jgi:hypothetical protein
VTDNDDDDKFVTVEQYRVTYLLSFGHEVKLNINKLVCYYAFCSESYINTSSFCQVLLIHNVLQKQNKLLVVEAEIIFEIFEIFNLMS